METDNKVEKYGTETYRYIARALAGRYEVIYYVNMISDAYYEYSCSKEYESLAVKAMGDDFFAEVKKNVKTDVYEEDVSMVAKFLDKENLQTNLEKSGQLFLDYRLMLEGRPQYVTLMVLSSDEDKDHIILAVDNIDAAKQKELAFERVISSTMDVANKDVLTGVKNKHAFVQSEMLIDDEIPENDDLKFAVVVCDINGLKHVNDELGHKAGDEYIKDGCRIICEIFAHSPVFRIGGDEFVAILKGSDYDKRNKLITELALRQTENREKNLVTLAYGMSEYRYGKDHRLQDVFERADVLMYENKNCFKHGIVVNNYVEKKDYSEQFYPLYEQLVSAMTEINRIDVPFIEHTLIEISKLFRLSKGVTRVYMNPQEEAEGRGETLSCFDTGKGGHVVSELRVVTSVMSSAVMTVYMSDDEEPLSDDEKWKVELVMRTTLSFISRNRLKDIVENLAYYDDAGYPNLRSFNMFVMKLAANGMITGKTAIRYNLRHFSVLNQELGRDNGDRIMKLHYDKLKKVMGPDSFISRLGGDNFVGICSSDNFDEVKKFLYETKIVLDKDNTVNVQTRSGIFCIPDKYAVNAPSDILEKITGAYGATREYDNETLVIYDDRILERRQNTLRVQQLLPDALKNEEFKIYYQPKVNVFSGKVEGAEALCRWIHNGTMIMPNNFIPMLEEKNDICRLDIYMLEHVLKNMKRWIIEGKNPVRVSVNFSRKNIVNAALPDIIEDLVDRYGIPHKYIEIELTETTTDVEFNDLKKITTKLHDLGFYISMDDFGVGFSSLNLIKDIPWNVIKIDRSFLPLGEDDGDNARMVLFKHVVSLTRSLGLECVAEGVETEAQIELLRENFCELAQGYYYDKPLPVLEFENKYL